MKRLPSIGVLVLLVVGAFSLLRFAPLLHAQDESNTPEEISKQFLLRVVPNQNVRFHEDKYSEESVATNLDEIVSRKDFDKLTSHGVEQVTAVMWRRAAEAQWETTRSENSPAERRVTIHAQRNINPSYPVVCIKEGTAWRVDIVETFGKWFDLDEQRKQEEIVEITGVALSPLAYQRDGGNTLCQKRLQQLALGFAQYVQDYDEQYPPAKTWCDAIKPYISGEELFHCPVANNNYGYAMNWRVSKRNQSEMNESFTIALLYESLTQRRNHSGEGKGIAYRHKGGTNMAFVDGHVQWLPRNSQEKWPDVMFTVR